MLNRNLTNYIRKNLVVGYDINTIKNFLIRRGYNINDIDETISSLGSFEEQKRTTEHNNLLDLFLRPRRFFEDFNYSAKKAFKSFLFTFFVVFLVQTIIIVIKNIFIGESIRNVSISILTNTLVLLLFLVVLCLFLVLLVAVYFVLFGYILKGVGFSLLFAMLFFSSLPYILINSIGGLSVYNLISLVNVSIGLLNINVFFLWSLLLFSLAISRKLGISFKKSLSFVFVPFALVIVLLVLVFYSIVRINLLWFIFEKF